MEIKKYAKFFLLLSKHTFSVKLIISAYFNFLYGNSLNDRVKKKVILV